MLPRHATLLLYLRLLPLRAIRTATVMIVAASYAAPSPRLCRRYAAARLRATARLRRRVRARLHECSAAAARYVATRFFLC